MISEKYIILTHLVNKGIEVAYYYQDNLPCTYDSIEEAEKEMKDFSEECDDDFIGKVVVKDNVYHIYNVEGNEYYFSLNYKMNEYLNHYEVPPLIKTLVEQLNKLK